MGSVLVELGEAVWSLHEHSDQRAKVLVTRAHRRFLRGDVL